MIIACPRCGAAYAVDSAIFGARARVVQCCECAYRWSQPPEAETEATGDDYPAPCVRQSRPDDSPEMFATPPEEGDETAALSAPSPPESVEKDAASTSTMPCGAEEDGGRNEDAIPSTAKLLERSGGEPPAADASNDQPPTPSGRGSHAVTAACAAAAAILLLTALLILLRGPIVSAMPEAAGIYGLLGLATDPLGQGLAIRDVASARDRVDGREVLTVTGVVANVTGSRQSLPSLRVTLYDDADEELQSVAVAQARTSLDAGEMLRFEARIPAPQPDARSLRVGFAAPSPSP